MIEEFKVRVGVEVNTDGVQAQLNTIKDKKIPVKIEISNLNEINNVIKNLSNGKMVKIGADDSGIKKKLSGITKSINGTKSMKSIKLDADTSAVERKVSKAFKSVSNVSTKPIKVSVDTSPAEKELRSLTSVIEMSEDSVEKFEKLFNNFGGNVGQISSVTDKLKEQYVEISKISYAIDKATDGKKTISLVVEGVDEAGNAVKQVQTLKQTWEKIGDEKHLVWNTDVSSKITGTIVDNAKAMKQAAKDAAAAEREAASASKKSAQDAASAAAQRQKLINTYKAEKQALVDIESRYKKINNPTPDLNKSYNQFRNATKNLFDTENYKDDAAVVREFGTAFETVKNQLSIVSNEEKEAAAEAQKLATAIETAATSSTAFNNLDAKFTAIKQKTESAIASVKKLNLAQKELNSAYNVYKADPSIKNRNALYESEKKFQQALKETEIQVDKNISAERKRIAEEKNAANAAKQIAEAEKLRTKAGNLSLSMDVWLEKNSKASEVFRNQIRKLQTQLIDCDSVQLSNIQEQFKTVTLTAQKTGEVGLNFADRLKVQFTRLAGYFGASSVIMGGIQTFRKMADNVLEVDTQMTELKRVTDLTSSQYDDLYNNMIASAKEYGATLSDIISSTADWSRAGFDPDTANRLSEITMMYEHIADIDYDEATKNLLTTYKGFQKQLDSTYGDTESSVLHVTDVLNELDNNYSVTAAGVGEALRRAAASMDVANNSFEQTAALVTGAVEVTQDPEGAGNALKVVSMRLRGAKGELEDMGEEVDDNVVNLTKMQGQILNLTHGKVNIFEDNGDFKSTYEILQGIHDVWDDLSDIEQADLLENVAGKHRANTVASILANWEDVEKAYQSALNSTGSAAEENAKYMDSLQGRLNNLTTVFQSFSNTVMKSDFLKGFVDAGSGALDILDELISKAGLFPTLLAGVSAALTPKGFGGIFKVVEDDAARTGKRITTIFGDIKSVINGSNIKPIFNNDFTSQLNNDIKSLRDYKLALANGSDVGDAFAKNLAGASAHMQEYAKSTNVANLSAKEFATAERMRQVTIKASNTSLSRCREIIAAYNDDSKRSGLSQQQFIDAVKKGNSQLASYLTGLNGAKGGIIGYTASLVAAKAATVALEVATMAFNAAISLGVGIAIQALISWISDMIHAEENLAEKVDEVTQKYTEQQEKIRSAKSLVEEVSPGNGSKSRYQELANGVDALGRNVSLTADEYSEYHDIVNQIADTFPELIQGFDSEGNAILSCKDNLSALTDAYKNMQLEANKELLDNDDDIAKDFQNNLKNVEKKADMSSESVSTLNKIMKSSNLHDAIFGMENFENSYKAEEIVKAIKNAYKNAGIEDELPEMEGVMSTERRRKFIEQAIQNHREIVSGMVSDFDSQMKNASSEMKTLANTYLSDVFLRGNYSGLSDGIKSVASEIVAGFDIEKIMGESKDPQILYDYINDMLNTLDRLSDEDASKLEKSFNLKTEFNDGKMTFGEYKSQLEDVSKIIENSGLKEDIQSQLKLSLNTDQVQEDWQTLVNKLDEHGMKNAEDFVNSLTADEYSAAQKLIINGEIDWKDKTPEQIKAEIDDLAKYSEAMNFTFDINAETEGIEKLNSAMQESVSAAGLTAESISIIKSRYSSLDGYDPSSLFEKTANGIKLNSQELAKLESQYANTNADKMKEKLSTLSKKYNELTKQIDNASSVGERASLVAERDGVKEKIDEISTLAAQYDGVTSAYNRWIAAQEGTDNREGYTSIATSRKDIEEELSRGWLDEGTKRYIDLLSFDDLADATYDEYIKAYNHFSEKIGNTGYSINDFFTLDEDGKETTDGIYNFFEAVNTEFGEGFAKLNDNDEWIVDLSDGKLDQVAEKFGMSAEAVTLLIQAYEDAGGKVNWDSLTNGLDLAVGKYDKFIEKAEKANETLKNLDDEDKRVNYDFDFNTTDADKLDEQLKVAADAYNKFTGEDGKINLDIEGAKEAQTVLETLVSQKLLAEQPAYMYVDASQVEQELQRPLQMLQEYQDKKNLVSELETKQKYGIAIDESQLEQAKKDAEAALKSTAEYLSGLSDDTKVKLNIDTNASVEDIQKSISEGTIQVPTELELSMNTNDLLKQIVDQMRIANGQDPIYNVDVKVGAENVDTSDVESETGEAVEEATSEPVKAEQDVDIEVNPHPTENDSVGWKFGQWIKETFFGDEEPVTISKDVEILPGNVDTLEKTEIKGGKVYYEGELTKKPALLLNGQVVYNGEVVNEADVERKDGNVYYKGQLVEEPVLLFDNGQVYYNGELANPESITYKDGKIYYDGQLVQTPQLTFEDGQVYYQGQVIKDPQLVFNNGQVNYNGVLASKPDLDLSGTITYTIKTIGSIAKNIFGGGEVDGTAHVNGTALANNNANKAFAQGDWGTKENGVALGGELGTELLVRDGRWYTIGENSAEFFGYKKGDIIFNADQTKEIFEKGKITHGSGRGKALAEGTAFHGATASGPGRGHISSSSSFSSSSRKSSSKSSSSFSSSSSSSSSDDADDFEETLDWIEIKISRIERAISKLDLKASSVYKKWSTRNAALADEIGKVSEEIDIQSAGADRYLQQANSIGLSEEYASKVRNGTIDIETIYDEDLKEKISDYQTWYEKYLDCIDACEELKEKEAELYHQRFDNVSEEYDGILSKYENWKSVLEEKVNVNETRGYIVSNDYYKELQENEHQKANNLRSERAELIKKRDDAVNGGKIKEGSKDWNDMNQAIDDVTLSIYECQTAWWEYEKTMRETDWKIFDLLQERITNVADETQFLIDLLDNKKLYEDNGQLTDEGMAQMGLHGIKYDTYMYQADKYREEMNKLDKQIAEDPYNQDLISRRQELLKLQQESISAAEDEKNAIKDMVEEGINKELDSLQKLIDKYNDALDSQKDLYDYQKKVQEQADEISKLEKQMSAYKNDDSEESKKKIQQIKVDLKEARDNLEETEYDKYVSDQKKLLDELYNEYEIILNERLDNIDVLMTDMIAEINNNAGTISSTVHEAADNVGYTLTPPLESILAGGASNTQQLIGAYGDTKNAVVTSLNTINQNILAMVAAISARNQSEINDAKKSTADNTPVTKPEPPKQEEQPQPPQQEENQITIGGQINAGDARIYADSEGNGGGRQYYADDPIYTVIDERNGYILTRWHGESSGYTGWFWKDDVSAYASGKKKLSSDELAWTQENGAEMIVRPSDGAILTPLAKNDSVLNANASRNIWSMANSPSDFIRDNLDVDSIKPSSANGGQTTYTQNLESVVFSLPNVKNYDELLSAMQRDRNFERLINSMTIDRMAGKSALAKGKAIR